MEPPPPIHQYRGMIVKERSTTCSAFCDATVLKIRDARQSRRSLRALYRRKSHGLKMAVQLCGQLGLDPIVRPNQSAAPDYTHDPRFAYQLTAWVTAEYR